MGHSGTMPFRGACAALSGGCCVSRRAARARVATAVAWPAGARTRVPHLDAVGEGVLKGQDPGAVVNSRLRASASDGGRAGRAGPMLSCGAAIGRCALGAG